MVLSVFAFLGELAGVEVSVPGSLGINHDISYSFDGCCEDFREVLTVMGRYADSSSWFLLQPL